MTEPLITADHVDLDLRADDRATAVSTLARLLCKAGRVSDIEQFLRDVEAREAAQPTGLEGGIGIPHCRSAAVLTPSLAFGRSAGGVDFGAADGPARLIFLIAAPEGADDEHLGVLSALARRLVRPSFIDELATATDPRHVASYVDREVSA